MKPEVVGGDLLDQDVEAIVNAWNRNIIFSPEKALSFIVDELGELESNVEVKVVRFQR